MTVENIIDWLGGFPNLILIYFSSLLLISILGSFLVTRRNFRSPISYLYGGLVYAVTLPAILSGVLILYSLFFLKLNLLQLNIFTYYLPVVFSVITLIIINKTVALKSIPGFDRLSGLVTLITGAMLFTYLLQKMFFGVFFIGNISYLIAFFGVIFLGLKIGWDKLSS